MYHLVEFLLFDILQSSNESIADEDSEDALSRADSKTDSQTDLPLTEHMEGTMQPSPMNSSKQSLGSDTDGEALKYSEGSLANTSKSPSPKIHRFQYKNFNLPIKCNYCTSLLVGVYRQGVVCSGKNISCWISLPHNSNFQQA